MNALKEKFDEDVQANAWAEQLVQKLLMQAGNLKVRNVANIPEYYHKGDLIAESQKLGKDIYIDVKNTNCYKYQSWLAEDYVWYQGNQEKSPGFMRNSSYDYIAFVCADVHKIFLLDYHKWKRYYLDYGYSKEIRHFEKGQHTQTTYGRCMSFRQAKQLGITSREIDYTYDANNQPVLKSVTI